MSLTGAYRTLAMVLLCMAATGAAEKLKPEQLVTRHLDEGLGQAALRAGHDVAVTGVAEMSGRQVGTGVLAGSFQFDSTALTSKLLVLFGTNTYDGETFAFDGQDTDVGFGERRPGQRSAIGGFIAANDVMLREGLLGGTLNARWALLDLTRRQAKIRYDGMKTFDGRQLHRLWYRAKKGQDQLEIHLYFEPDTYRHVATVYSRSRAQNLGASIVDSSQEADVHFLLEERFSEFTNVDGVTLPTAWSLRYERSANTTVEWKYQFKASSIRRKAPAVANADADRGGRLPGLGAVASPD